MSKSVAELEVQLELATAQFEASAKEFDRELKKMEKNTARTARSFNKFEGQVARLGKGLAVAAAAAATAFAGQAARGAVEYADTLAKTAAKVGVTVEELQKLRFAASQSGVDIRTLDMGLQRFSRRVGEVANGSGELYKVWQQLGIELRNQDGSMRSTAELFSEYADAVKNAESSQAQLLLTFKAVDSEAAGLVNLLKTGAIGIQEYSARAEELGLVMDETAVKAEVVADKVGELGLTFKNRLTNWVVDATYALMDFFNATQLDDEAGIRDRMKEIEDLVGQELQLQLQMSKTSGELDISADKVERLWQEYDQLQEALDRILDMRAEARNRPSDDETIFGNNSAENVKRLKEQIRGLVDPTVAFQKAVQDAYELTKDSTDPLALETYYKYVEVLAERWRGAMVAVEDYGSKVAAVLAETDSTRLINEQAEALGVLYSALENASDPAQYERIMAMIEELTFGEVLEPPADLPTQWEDTMAEIKDAIDGFVSDFTNKFVDGLLEGEMAFDDFAKNILSTIAKLMLNKIFTQFFDLILGSIPGFGTGASGSGTNVVEPTNISPQVANPYSRSSDGVVVPMISSAARGGTPSLGNSPVTVNVINNGNSEVEVEERRTSRGIEIDVLVKQAVNRGIQTGDFDNSMRSAFGTRRVAY